MRERIVQRVGPRWVHVVEDLRRGDHRLNLLDEVGIGQRGQGDLQHGQQDVDDLHVRDRFVVALVFRRQLRRFLTQVLDGRLDEQLLEREREVRRFLERLSRRT